MSLADSLLNMTVEQNPTSAAVEPEVTVEFGAELNDLRQRIVKGEEVTRDELRAAIITLRDTFGKKAAAAAAPKKKAAAKKAPAKKMSEDQAANLLDSLFGG